jgi:hypothetical protein
VRSRRDLPLRVGRMLVVGGQVWGMCEDVQSNNFWVR